MTPRLPASSARQHCVWKKDSMLRGFIIFFIQSIALSCFFAFFFEGKKKLLTIACMLCVFNLILLPIALLISNSYLIIPINLFIIYLTLRLLFPKESKLYCFFSVILYTVTSLAADIFTFFLFLFSGLELLPTTIEYSYPTIFYVIHYIMLISFFAYIILYFGHPHHHPHRIMLWQIYLMIIQILSFLFLSFGYYQPNPLIITIYFVLYFTMTIIVLNTVYSEVQRKKLEISTLLLQEQLQKQCEEYIALKNMEQYRKLRHDYLNFMNQKNHINH